MIEKLFKLYKDRRQRIKPIQQYKVSKKGHLVLDVVNFRRLIILFLFVTSCIAWGFSGKVEAMFLELRHTETVETRHNQVVDTITSYIKQFNVEPHVATTYATLIYKYSNEQGVDPYVLTGLIKVESTFNRYAVSKVNALGLTQVMPVWHKEKIDKIVQRFGYCDFLSPEHSVLLGAMVLKEYKKKHNGNINKALLSYNGSLNMKDADYDRLVLTAANNARNANKWKQRYSVASL